MRAAGVGITPLARLEVRPGVPVTVKSSVDWLAFVAGEAAVTSATFTFGVMAVVDVQEDVEWRRWVEKTHEVTWRCKA